MKPEPAHLERPAPIRSTDDNARLDRIADQDFEQGRGVTLKDAVAWVRSWFTPHELQRPKSRKNS